MAATYTSTGRWSDCLAANTQRELDEQTRLPDPLDLKDDLNLAAEYKRCCERIWPEITASLRQAGIQDVEIYLLGTRMFMILEATDSFSCETGRRRPENPNWPWEEPGWNFQRPLPRPKREKDG